MKILVFTFGLLALSTSVFGEEIAETHKRHRSLRHEENRKWSLARDKCYANFPMGYKASHADYDKQFRCLEDIQDARQAFEDKLRTEICELYNVSCSRSVASVKDGLE